MSIQKILEKHLRIKPEFTEQGLILTGSITGIPEAVKEIEAIKQSEVCKNCREYGHIYGSNEEGEYIIEGCLYHNIAIEKPTEQSCIKDFKRKDGK